MIFCHQGASNGPPEDLEVGQVIDVQGEPWALVSIGSGFASAAYQFRPHRERELLQIRLKLPPRRSIPLNVELVQEAFAAMGAAMETPEFTDSDPSELRRSFALIENAWELSNALVMHLSRCHRHERDPERKARLSKQIDIAIQANKQIHYQRRDAQHFCRHYLGENNRDQ